MINSYYINSFYFIVILFILFVSFSFSLVYPLENNTKSAESNVLKNPLNIEITSHYNNMSIPIGNLTIYGKSSDNLSSNCSVFVSWGEDSFQVANPIGSGDEEDYSTWSFTYDTNYHEIITGNNKLNAKISCIDDQSNEEQTSVLVIGQPDKETNINNIKNQTNSNNVTNMENINLLNRSIDYDYIESYDTPIEIFDNSKIPKIFNDQNTTLNGINDTSLNNISNIIETKPISANISLPQTIFIGDIVQLSMTVYDPGSSQPLSKAHVVGNIHNANDDFMRPLKFTGDTDKNGTYSFSWKIIDNHKPGNYTLSIIVQAQGYDPYSVVNNFKIQNNTLIKLSSDEVILTDQAREKTFEDVPESIEETQDQNQLETFEDVPESIEETQDQ
ncbi:MAG: carboxypeptidase-like regulatory domain-containing protein, partial [Nitrososphaeraceae archaeon]